MTPERAAKLHLACEAMRTRFEILLADPRMPAADQRAAGEAALEEIAAVERRLSVYRSESDLFAVNAYAAAALTPVDARTLAFLREAQRLSRMTEGTFDPTVGPLLALWGLSGGDSGGRVPTDSEIAEALQSVGMMRLVELDGEAGTVAFTRAGVRLDPGGIGKGYGLERAADLLRESGIRCALLHGGTSTVCAIGAPPESPEGWQVAIQHPLDAGSHLAVASLRDISLSVSAVHGKSFWAQGRRFGHVVDPRTGRPVENTVLAAVVAPSATETDALSTALLVLGKGGLPLLASRFPHAAFLVATQSKSHNNELHVVATGEAWHQVRFTGEVSGYS